MSKLNRNDKMSCLIFGNQAEKAFLGKLFHNLVSFSWNPLRARNWAEVDFLMTTPADLKAQWEPFHHAEQYRIHPENALTINLKDYERYSKLSPNTVIVWWIKHSNVEKFPYAILYDIRMRIERPEYYAHGEIPLHKYVEHRENQANECYVLDSNWFPYLQEADSCYVSDEKLAQMGATREQWEAARKNASTY